MADMNGARGQHAATVYGDSQIFVGTGFGGAGVSSDKDYLEVYDIAADTWTIISGTLSSGLAGQIVAVGKTAWITLNFESEAYTLDMETKELSAPFYFDAKGEFKDSLSIQLVLVN